MFILLFDRLTGGFSFLNFHVIWITKKVSHMYFRMQKIMALGLANQLLWMLFAAGVHVKTRHQPQNRGNNIVTRLGY
jgi:hypothetical protein